MYDSSLVVLDDKDFAGYEINVLENKYSYISVKEYASIHNVSTTTVRQWIRRGKIRTAKKNGRDWLILSNTGKPRRGFIDVKYSWSNLPCAVTRRFPYLNNCNSIYIRKCPEDKSIYKCSLHNFETSSGDVCLSIEERESLELALLSTSAVCMRELE